MRDQLKDFPARDFLEEQTQEIKVKIADMVRSRKEKARSALEQGKLICDLENPKFAHLDFQRQYAPTEKNQEFALLEDPNQDEGHICLRCSTDLVRLAYPRDTDKKYADKFIQ